MFLFHAKKLLHIGIITLGLACTSLYSHDAHAAFVATDWKVVGDKKATLDTDTGIEWLDLSETRGRSIQWTLDNLTTLYPGWRLPTQSEVQQMMRNFFAGVYNFSPTTGRVNSGYVTKTRITQFESLFSRVFYQDGNRGIYFARGLYLGDDGNVKSAGSHRNTYWGGDSHWLDYMHNVSTSISYSDGTCKGSNTNCYSVWLVSDGGVTLSSINDPTINAQNPNAPINDVSALTPATLGFAGIVALMYAFRRKKQH